MSPLEKQPTFWPTLGSSPSWTNVLGFYGFNPFNKGPTWRRGMTVECGWRHLSWDTPVWMGSWLSWIIVFQHGNWNSPSFSKGPSWKIHEHHHLDGGYPLSILYQKGVLISWDVRIGHQWPLWRMRCCSVDHRELVTFLVSHHSLKSTPRELDKRRYFVSECGIFFIFHCWKHVVPGNVSMVCVTTICMLPKTPTDISWEHWVFVGCIESKACSFVSRSRYEFPPQPDGILQQFSLFFLRGELVGNDKHHPCGKLVPK